MHPWHFFVRPGKCAHLLVCDAATVILVGLVGFNRSVAQWDEAVIGAAERVLGVSVSDHSRLSFTWAGTRVVIAMGDTFWPAERSGNI